jgi:hypothetical protein
MAGARPERKKWIHHFANADCVIFCAALTDYNLVMREESEVVRVLPDLHPVAHAALIEPNGGVSHPVQIDR